MHFPAALPKQASIALHFPLMSAMLHKPNRQKTVDCAATQYTHGSEMESKTEEWKKNLSWGKKREKKVVFIIGSGMWFFFLAFHDSFFCFCFAASTSSFFPMILSPHSTQSCFAEKVSLFSIAMHFDCDLKIAKAPTTTNRGEAEEREIWKRARNCL